jgi:RND family efflux transporter MFP subunit
MVQTFLHGRSPVAAVLLCVGLALIGCDAQLPGVGAAADSTDGAPVIDARDARASSAPADSAETAEKKPAKKPARERSTNVDVATASRGELVIPISAEGTLRARNTAMLGVEVSGRLVALSVEEGTRVRRGELIAQLDDREYQVAIDEARATYLQSVSRYAVEEGRLDDLESPPVASDHADLDREIATLDRLERQGKISHDERFARELELQVTALREGSNRQEVVSSRSGVSAAHAALERARLNLERTTLRAPFSGIVSNLDVTKGELLRANDTVCELVDDVNIEAEVAVLESDLGGVVVGRPVLLAIPALADTIVAVVDVVSPAVDQTSRTCKVLVRVDSQEGRLRPGMFVRAAIAGQSFGDRLLVPREAVLTREGRTLVFKADGDRAKWLYVDLGERNDRFVEVARVLQGGTLEPGDKVIVNNHLTLAHDAKIKVKKTLAVDNPWVRD